MRKPVDQLNRPMLIVHADWGSQPVKRWMACAELCEGSYHVKPPEKVGELANFLQSLKSKSGPGGCVLLGFDFPIGLPNDYAQRVGVVHFFDFLNQLDRREWSDFFHVAETVDQISIHRPFYPYRPGSSSHQQLLDKLGFQSIDALRRACEQAPPLARPAAPLFWTLGAQQVGRAALNGWEKVLVPGLKDSSLDIVIWPFSGRMRELIQTGRLIIAETYPALYLHQLNLVNHKTRFSKRRQSDRAGTAERLIRIYEASSLRIHPDLELQMREGFGSGNDGDDRFDAVLGLFGMLRFLIGKERLPEPSDVKNIQVEGWILGLPPS